jgi:hypothetical protein
VIPEPETVIKSESATFHRSVELSPLSTQESAVKDMTFGHAGATGTGRTVTTAVFVTVWGEQPSLVTVRV